MGKVVRNVGGVWGRVQSLRQAALRHRLEAARVHLARRLVGQADPPLHRVLVAGGTYTPELLALRCGGVPAARLQALLKPALEELGRIELIARLEGQAHTAALAALALPLLLVLVVLALLEPERPVLPEPDRAPPRPPPIIVTPAIQTNAPNSL